ncbi:sensor histidine kinase [Legionella tunisiensis]|uniref:sensor histidine kinase n=1 Tax=Legionella tunisiensis TaxID=1034944 RepID=UPI0002E0CB8D|nr:ATP-binding protein [Legionella tunisiensis]
MIDNKLIQEVLFHLLDNAIKYSPPESPIHILVEATQENVVISIEDFGSGIIPQEKNKVFRKFYRGKQVLSEHGLGLGLAICQKIITAHEGRIWVENIENKGAAFRVSLPLNMNLT